MNRPILFICFCFITLFSRGQQERLPADLRQHNLTTFNSSLFNPAFSLDRNNPESVALWVRWQWQGIDSDPSTLFLNYTRPFNERSAAGAAFFQHNTGIFFNTGGAINYAYKFDLNPRVRLSVGANLFGFTQKLVDDRFQVDPVLPLFPDLETSDFILQFAPGISLEVERLTLSLASENLVDYNFGAKEGNTAKEDKIFMSLLSYDFPVDLGSATNAFLRPSMYLRTLPGQSNQVGFYTLLNTNAYWGQVGYNNFYGFAIGGGYTLFDRVTVGALAEFGTGASIVKESSFELMASYFLGTPEERHKMVGHDLDEELNPLESIEEEQAAKAMEQEAEEQNKEAEKLKKRETKRQQKREKAVRDSITKQEKEAAEILGEQQKEVERAAANEQAAEAKTAEEKATEEAARRKAEQEAKGDALRAEQQRKIDSVAEAKAAAVRAAKKAEEIAAREKETKTRKEAETVEQPKPGEKYEEVSTEAGLLPGYYLIANVFGTQKYYDAFMADLKAKGMQPKSFRRSTNGFNYVYLQRYKTIGQARAARDSKYDGRYSGPTWIFRVRGE